MIDASLLPVAVVVLVIGAVATVLAVGTLIVLALEHVRARRRPSAVQPLPVTSSAAGARAA